MLTGCDGNNGSKSGIKVITIMSNEWGFEKLIETDNNGIESESPYSRGGYERFLITAQEFVDLLNEKAAALGYGALKEIEMKSFALNPPHHYSYDDKTKYLEIYTATTDPDKIQAIRFHIKTDSVEQAKMNGDYIYLIFDTFNPGMQEDIADILYIFEGPKGIDYPYNRMLTVGNTVYEFTAVGNVGDYISIAPAKIIPEPEPQTPSAIRPN
ncbi:MAG: hypothetical protein ACOWWO_12005 [Peptococcaceae bacterium]